MLKPTGSKLFVKKVSETKEEGIFVPTPSETSYLRCEIVEDSPKDPLGCQYVRVQKRFLDTEISPDVFIIEGFCVDAKEVDDNTPIEEAIETIPDQEAVTAIEE